MLKLLNLTKPWTRETDLSPAFRLLARNLEMSFPSLQGWYHSRLLCSLSRALAQYQGGWQSPPFCSLPRESFGGRAPLEWLPELTGRSSTACPGRERPCPGSHSFSVTMDKLLHQRCESNGPGVVWQHNWVPPVKQDEPHQKLHLEVLAVLADGQLAEKVSCRSRQI